jgi:hypothetical protein
VLVLVVVVGLFGLVRQLLLDRTPRRAINGRDPVIGSLDTWPAVPRRPTNN